MRVSIHPLTLPLLAIICALFMRVGDGVLAALLFAVMSHEAGHLLLLSVFSVPVSDARISVRGVRMTAQLSAVSYTREALIAGAGIFVNLLCGGLFLLFGMERAALPSLLLGCYNLLPLSSFDGGRILCALLYAYTPLSPSAAGCICRVISGIVLCLLYLFCGWYFWALSMGGGMGAELLGGVWFFAVWGIVMEELHVAG